jgi:DMSO/TMAO reductase YedYZ molybdopterin-dependent catalytic subunit
MKNLFIAIAIIFTAVFTVIFIFHLHTNNVSAQKLPPVEVREYQGKKLSSINDFRENSIEGPQKIDITKYRLSIDGLVKKPLSYTYDDVLTMKSYTKVITLNCVEEWSVTILWQGVLMKDLLENSAIENNAKTVIFHAVDGYTTSLPLNYIMSKNIILAYKMNGATMTTDRGYPFQLVAEDKWGYKWIRWVTRIEVSADEKYRGYWEKRGFSQKGDSDKSYNE